MTKFYEQVKERLMRYARINTESDPHSTSVPTTSCQHDLAKVIYVSIPWWRSHPIHKNRATESIWTEPCNPLLRAAKSTKRATFNL